MRNLRPRDVLCLSAPILALVALSAGTRAGATAGGTLGGDVSTAIGSHRGVDVLDVALGGLANIAQVPAAHVGSYPNGRVGLAMSTTSCNVGTVNVPWEAPMNEEHPIIAFQLYREMDGRFEQIGVSWVKHAFYALSENACSFCQNQTDGSELGVGCSDTYGNGNNSDRWYLGPREEIDPYAGTWSCEGSYFAAGQPDCIDRRFDVIDDTDAVEHRLEVLDADLDNAGAEYIYEALYVVAGDEDKSNNIGSRRCVMTWSGATWIFGTPQESNDLLLGPALERWGEMQSWAEIGSTDGRVLLAVETTDLGGGEWRYEYALFNFDSARRIGAFTVPVGDAIPTDVTFHDWDADASNDWAVTESPGAITWETESFETNPDANALTFGLLFNFGFTHAGAPVDALAQLGVFAPSAPARGEPDVVSVGTRAPDKAVPTAPGSGATGVTPAIARLGAPSPNPTGLATIVPVALDSPAVVTLAIYDAGGRRVRSLVEGRALPAGEHRIVWDGLGADGTRVGAGVYFARLAANGTSLGGRSVVVTR